MCKLHILLLKCSTKSTLSLVLCVSSLKFINSMSPERFSGFIFIKNHGCYLVNRENDNVKISNGGQIWQLDNESSDINSLVKSY